MFTTDKINDSTANSKEELGKKGEDAIARKLFWVNLLGCRGKLLRNVYVPKQDGGTTEIDLLYLTRKGIFVIESKNFSGYIFGRESNQKWVASLYGGKDAEGQKKSKKEFFYNPIRQNNTHMKHLSAFLPDKIPMFSLIVFSDRCELKYTEYNTSKSSVCQQAGMMQELKRIWKKNQKVLTRAQIKQLYQTLEPLTKVSDAVKMQHIEEIHSLPSASKACSPAAKDSKPDDSNSCKPNTSDSKPNTPEPSTSPEPEAKICPRCGGTLVLRTAKSGANAGKPFYGCSNYPHCRYIKNL